MRQSSRFSVRLRACVALSLIVASAAWLQPRAADAEVHHFCTVMAGTQCHLLRARNAALLDQIAQQVRSDAAAQRAVSAVRSAAVAGTLKGADFDVFARTVRSATPEPMRSRMDVLLAQVAVNQQVQSWLLRGTPWNRVVPPGDNVPIALVPGLPRGQLIPLGFGPVLIGLDRGGDAIVLGEGNPTQVAAQISGNSSTSETTLANSTSVAVNFLVNQQSQALAAGREKRLSGSSSWTVTFDRGAGRGTARYQVGEGLYEFEATEQGLELYHKEAGATDADPQPSAYVQASHVELPKGFKLFDPIPVINHDAPEDMKLPEQFTLFREAAGEISRK